jgi:4-amino-4-deoxy-L-arabinose transferase-like glycosyltransferase
MIFKKYTFILFFLILSLGVFLRTYKLDAVPPSPFSDEVDVGYQAITFTRTQTDYYGNKFPIFFQSFSDWHTPLTIIPIALCQKIFGINIYSLKIPSIIFGIFTTIIFYFLLKKISKSEMLAIIGFFLISISPWHIHYSRITFESVSGMFFFILLGFYFWQKFIDKNSYKNLLFSLFCFSITPYFYSTAKLFLFFIYISLIIIWKDVLQKLDRKKIIISIIFSITLLIPLIYSTVTSDSNIRFSYINIFSNSDVPKTINFARLQDAVINNGDKIGQRPDLISKIYHNKISEWSNKFLSNYFLSFSSDFLFVKGDDNPRQGFGNQGYLFYLDLFTIIIGISYSLKLSKKNSLFFLLLLIFAPIPFSLTRDSSSAHATRLILMLPSFIYFSSFGLLKIIKSSKTVFLIFTFFYIIQFSSFWHHYLYHYPQMSARYWHTGIKEAIAQANHYQNNYQKIYYSNTYESMIPFFLYYNQYKSPITPKAPIKSLISENKDAFSGMQLENKYYFGHLEWSRLVENTQNYQDALFIITKMDKDAIDSRRQKIKIIETIKPRYLESETFYLITFKNE